MKKVGVVGVEESVPDKQEASFTVEGVGYAMRALTLLWFISTAVALSAGGVRPAQAQQPVPPSPEAGALDREYLHTVWTTEDGLPQNSINAIVQTRDGYLWLATFGGLVRFDGVTFTVFDLANADGLASNRTVSLYEDSKGVLWIGHETGEVTRYEDGLFRSYTGVDGLQGRAVVAFVEGEGQTLWMGTRRGLVRFVEGVFTMYTMRDGLPKDAVYSLLIDRAGRLWIGTDGGLARYEDGRFMTFTKEDGLPNNIVGELFEDREGRLWAGTAAGLASYQDDRFVPLTPADQPPWLIKGLEEDRKGGLWVGMGTPHQLLRFTGALMTPDSPPAITARFAFDAQLRTVFEDSEGNLWVGTDGDGLHRFREKPVRRYTTDDGLLHNSVFRITGDGDGGLWFNAACNNLTRYHDGTFTSYSTLPGGGKIGCVWSLLRDRSGVLWIGGDQNLIRLEEGAYTRYTPDDGLPGGHVLALFEDRDGDLWVGPDNNGVARFDGEAFTIYTPDDGLVHGDVRFITQGQDGAMWFGTREGLSRFQNGHFTNFTAADGLSSGMVRAIHIDDEGVVWVGTYGGGLSRLKDGQITRYTMDDGLFDNVVSRILEDDTGNLWMLGNLGLFFVNRQVLNDFAQGKRVAIDGVSLGPDEGMTEGNGGGQPAGWQTDDGRMWFPTIKGLAVVDAKNFQINDVPPPVVVERALIDGQVFDLRQPIEAPPGKSDLEIHYTGLSFVAPEKVRFTYKLEGYDAGWQEVGTRRVAYYTNVPPGSYTFRVQAANNDGVWNEAGVALSIALKPFFYETPWFYALCVLVLGWVGYTAFRLRTRRLWARNIRLQAEIIERKRVEEALQVSEARYRSVIEDQTEFIVRWLPDGTRTFVNDSYCRYFETPRRELVGSSFYPLISQEDREAVRRRIAALTPKSPVSSDEHRVLRPDGTIAWHEWADRAFFDEDGQVVELQSVGRDITERKRVEDALRASEERFARAFQAAPVPMIIVTVEGGRCIDVNQNLLDLFDFRRDEFVGKTIADLQFWDEPEERVRMVEMMRVQGHVRDMEVRFRTKTGGARDVLLSVEFVELSGLRCLLGVAQDVTERKRVQEALRMSEVKFSNAFRASPDAITISTIKEGRYVDVNQGFTDLLGYAREEAIGQTSTALNLWVHLEDRNELVQRLEEAGSFHDREWKFRTRSGQVRTCQVSSEAIDLEGEPCLISIVRDVTERKQAEEEREHLIDELEARNAELERFTYTVSHDLKTPLVTIKGFLGLLEQDALEGNAERVKGDIARIGSAADKMAHLLSELLELSRVGRLMNPPEDVALTSLAGEAVSLVAGQIAARGVTVEIDPNLPHVYGDRVRLLEVFQNLIDNAVKFMGEQPAPRIEVGGRRNDTGEVVCFVQDNGVGIDPPYHEKVFGLFDQLSPNGEGTGIGLALVRRIVEVHGGRIWVESEGEGQGSTFWFVLPSAS